MEGIRRMFKRFIPAILIFFALITLAQPVSPYYFKHEEGWWWYKEVIKRPEKKEEKTKKEKVEAKIKETGETEKKEETEKEKEKVKISKERLLEDLDKIPVKELRKRADIAIELALDNPSLENVRIYLTIQKAIMDRATRFAKLFALTTWLYPELDELRKHPTSAIGVNFANLLRIKKEDEAMDYLAKNGGLFFFFSNSCPFCAIQARILKVVQENYGVAIIPVSLDEKCLPEFPSCKPDNGMARRLNIEYLPAIYLAIPPDTIFPVSFRLITADELKDRVYKILNSEEIKAIREKQKGSTPAGL